MGGTILSSHRFWIVLGGFCLSALMIVGGVIGLLSVRNDAQVDRVLDEVYANTSQNFPAREMVRQDLRVSGDGVWVARAGAIAAYEAGLAGVRTAEGRVWLQRAIGDFRRGLALAPGNGLGWMRYAAALVRLNDGGARATAALRMALFTARNSSGVDRLQVALLSVLWPELDSETLPFARAVLIRNWTGEPRRRANLVPFTRNAGTQAILRDAIGAGADIDAWIAETLAAAEADRLKRERLLRDTMPTGP